MAISIELPTGIEQQLRGEIADLVQVAKEAALVELCVGKGNFRTAS